MSWWITIRRFFEGPVSSLPLGVYRCAHGIMGLLNGLLLTPDLMIWFADDGIIAQPKTIPSSLENLNLFNWVGGAHSAVTVIFIMYMLSALTLALGFYSRTSAFVFFICLVSFHLRNVHILSSADTIFRLMSFFLILAPCGTAFSLDRLLRIFRNQDSISESPKISAVSFRLMQLQLCLVYLATGIWKASGTMWISGDALFMVHQLEQFERFPVPEFARGIWFSRLATWGTLAVELASPLLLWFKLTRRGTLVVLLILHLGIEYTMNIQLFQPIMISTLLLFVREDEYRAMVKFIENRLRPLFQKKLVVIIDADCGFCRRSAAVLQCLDLFSRVEWRLNSDPNLSQEFPSFDMARSQIEVLAVDHAGVMYGGFKVFREISKRLPLLWGFAVLGYIPGLSLLGDVAYKAVARNRIRISTLLGLTTECSIDH